MRPLLGSELTELFYPCIGKAKLLQVELSDVNDGYLVCEVLLLGSFGSPPCLFSRSLVNLLLATATGNEIRKKLGEVVIDV